MIYCRLIAYRRVRHPEVAGIAVVPVWRDEADPVAKTWGQQNRKKYFTLRGSEAADEKWTEPLTGAEMFIIPKIWHQDATAGLAGFEVQIISDSRTFPVLLSQFFADPSFVKKLPRQQHMPAPAFSPSSREYRRG